MNLAQLLNHIESENQHLNRMAEALETPLPTASDSRACPPRNGKPVATDPNRPLHVWEVHYTTADCSGCMLIGTDVLDCSTAIRRAISTLYLSPDNSPEVCSISYLGILANVRI